MSQSLRISKPVMEIIEHRLSAIDGDVDILNDLSDEAGADVTSNHVTSLYDRVTQSRLGDCIDLSSIDLALIAECVDGDSYAGVAEDAYRSGEISRYKYKSITDAMEYLEDII